VYGHRKASATDAGAGVQTVSNRRLGLSLLETLIVIGIVVLIAALLIPLGGHLMRESKIATTLSNLSQIYSSSQLYFADNDDRYLPVDWVTPMNDYAERFKLAVKPYGSEEIFWSPLDRFARKECPHLVTSCTVASFENDLFITRMALEDEILPYPKVTSMPMSNIQNWSVPAERVVLLKSISLREPIITEGVDGKEIVYNSSNIGNESAYLFADGSAKFMPILRFLTNR
jgi:hypothetical protein